MLAWRLAETLPRAERRKLALRLIEADAEEIVFRRSGCTWTGFTGIGSSAAICSPLAAFRVPRLRLSSPG
jgi:hypothetical protein